MKSQIRRRQFIRSFIATSALAFALSGCGGGGSASSGSTTGTSAALTITSFNPSSGPQGTMVTITGTNFSTTPANNTVRLNSIAVPVTAATSTSLTITIPGSASTGTISVQAAGETATSADSFIVSAGVPTITSFSPDHAAAGATVTLTGTNFSTTPADNAVWLNGFAATVTAATETSLAITVPSVAETGNISVRTNGGVATSSTSFIVVPTIIGFNPTSGPPGSTVTITGKNFSKTGSVLFWNGNSAQVTARTSTSITVTAPNVFTTGPIWVEYDPNIGGVLSANNFVLNNPPVITSFTPNYGAGGSSVVIYANNLDGPALTANVVKIGGILAPVTYLCYYCAPTYLVATVPSGYAGMAGQVSVSRIDGTAITNENFYIQNTTPPPPNNTLSVSPNPLSFGSITVGSYAFGSVNVTNTGTVDLHITGAAVSGSNLEYRGTTCYGYNYLLQYHDTLSPGASCSVDVGFGPTAAVTSTGALSITSTAVGSPHTVSLSGTGVTPLAPAVSLSPASLTFAARELGTSSAAQTITLTNTGTAALNITNIGVSGEYVQSNACPASLAIGASCTINVTFSPIRLVGPKQGSVAISSDAPGSPHVVYLNGVGSLINSGQLAIFTRESWGVDNVYVDGAWVGRDLKYDSQNTCGGIGAITLTLAPGTHTIEAGDQVLSISPATVTVTEGGCMVHQITGTSTCLSPNFISNGVCYLNTVPTCTSPQVLQNGVCVTPGTSAGTGSGGSGSGTGSGGSGTEGGMAGAFVDTGAGTNATSCLSFGLLTGAAAYYNDTQTITNNCSFPVYVMRCHTPTTLTGTADTECNAARNGLFYQQFEWLQPGEVETNSYSLPPGTTIWYGACSGGSLPKGKEVSLTGDYVCN
jgi:hypothetical protein